MEMQSGHPAWGNFANRVLEWGPNPRNGNKSDQAHPPIHPTKYSNGMVRSSGSSMSSPILLQIEIQCSPQHDLLS